AVHRRAPQFLQTLAPEICYSVGTNFGLSVDGSEQAFFQGAQSALGNDELLVQHDLVRAESVLRHVSHFAQNPGARSDLRKEGIVQQEHALLLELQRLDVARDVLCSQESHSGFALGDPAVLPRRFFPSASQLPLAVAELEAPPRRAKHRDVLQLM